MSESALNDESSQERSGSTTTINIELARKDRYSSNDLESLVVKGTPLPSATILQHAELEEIDTVGFIVESKTDLRWTQVIDMLGALRIETL